MRSHGRARTRQPANEELNEFFLESRAERLSTETKEDNAANVFLCRFFLAGGRAQPAKAVLRASPENVRYAVDAPLGIRSAPYKPVN